MLFVLCLKHTFIPVVKMPDAWLVYEQILSAIFIFSHKNISDADITNNKKLPSVSLDEIKIHQIILSI